MNREDGEADHLAVTQSDMTRATSAALQAAAAQGSAGQRPSPGGSAEMSAEASSQHHPESENDSVAAAGAGVPVNLQEAPESEAGTPDRHGRQPASQDIIQSTPSSSDEYFESGEGHQNLGEAAEQDRIHDASLDATLDLPSVAPQMSSVSSPVAADGSAASCRPPVTLMGSKSANGGQPEPEFQQQSATASPDLAAISSENEPIPAHLDTQNPENPITGHADGFPRLPVMPTTAAERAAPEFTKVQAAGDGA